MNREDTHRHNENVVSTKRRKGGLFGRVSKVIIRKKKPRWWREKFLGVKARIISGPRLFRLGGEREEFRFYITHRDLRAGSLRRIKSEVDLVPQAILREPLSTFIQRKHSKILKDEDSFDEFEGVGYRLGAVPFAIMHYRGHPSNTSTIYLPRKIDDVEMITSIIDEVVKQFKLSPSAIEWQRKDDPEL